MENITDSEKKPIRWVSFQSLVGGMMIGAEKAFGTTPLFTIDYEGPDKGNSSAYLYYQNEIKHKNIRQLVLNGNLLSMATDFKSEEDEKFFQENCHDIDVVSAVPICSGLSAANTVNDKSKGTQRGAAAQQNNNMYGVAKMTFERIKPKVFIFENAPALFTNTGKAVRDKLRDMGKEHGYVVTWVKTNTNKHANVQYRSRTFGIFWRADVTPQLEFVDKAHGSIKEYLADISKDASYNTDEWIINPNILNNGWYKYLKAKYPTNWREYLATSKRGFWENFWDKLDFTEIKPYGQVIWGNRTLQKADAYKHVTAMGFLNLRNEVSDIKKLVYRAARRWMFEQNTSVLWVNFKSTITPLLERMVNGYGLSRYEIRKGAKTAKHKLYAEIRIWPIYAVEYIDVTIQILDEETIVTEE